jgi:hypothetical protein
MEYIQAEASRGRGKGVRSGGKSSAGKSSVTRTLLAQKGGRIRGRGRGGRGNQLNRRTEPSKPLKPPSHIEGMQPHDGIVSHDNDTNVQPPQSSTKSLFLSDDDEVESVSFLAFSLPTLI